MSTARVIPGDGVRALAAEFAGSALLLAIVVGSGVMGESLSAGVAGLALLANAAATAAGLTGSRREGRSIIYTANYDAMRDLLGFLMEDCCAGEPAICMPISEMARAACRTC